MICLFKLYMNLNIRYHHWRLSYKADFIFFISLYLYFWGGRDLICCEIKFIDNLDKDDSVIEDIIAASHVFSSINNN